jgi:hypothetical protein
MALSIALREAMLDDESLFEILTFLNALGMNGEATIVRLVLRERAFLRSDRSLRPMVRRCGDVELHQPDAVQVNLNLQMCLQVRPGRWSKGSRGRDSE